jgi:hypothetical protein
MLGRLARCIASVGVFFTSMLLMLFLCILVWDGCVNGKLYYCTDGGSMDFICVGDWVHHPESVAQVVPRSMDKPDEIKAGWSTRGLWCLWSAFVAGAVLVSAFFAGAVWRSGSPYETPRATPRTPD